MPGEGCDITSTAGECHFADVAGPIRPVGIGGAKYILVAADAFTVVIQSPLARSPLGLDVRTCRKQSDIPCLGGVCSGCRVERHSGLRVSLILARKE